MPNADDLTTLHLDAERPGFLPGASPWFVDLMAALRARAAQRARQAATAPREPRSAFFPVDP